MNDSSGIFRTAALAAILVLSTTPMQANTQSRQLVDRANNYYPEDCEMGIRLLTEAMQIDSANASAYFLRGSCYLVLANPQHAYKDFTSAIDLNPSDSYAWSQRGNALRDLGKYSLAIVDYSQAIRLNPQSGTLYTGRALLYQTIGNKVYACNDLMRGADRGDEQAKQISAKCL
ncbi:MAG: tetratricopeptide repeat protein [Prochlorococcus sp.]